MASTNVTAVAQQLRWAVVAAAATPRDAAGTVDLAVSRRYFQHLVADGADALAIAVHTGRGDRLTEGTRAELVAAAAALEVPVVAGVGATGSVAEVERWAKLAVASGATALLVFPPVGATTPADALAHHERVWQATGVPLVAFDLYLRPYSAQVLEAVLGHPGVAAFKPARLHDAVASQDGIVAARDHDVLVLSGEDRMLGPSLLWGAEGALVGLAAAATSVTTALVQARRDGAHAAFVQASTAVDELARVTFRAPVDGYVQRMLWIAADAGWIPQRYAVDPDRPADLRDSERDEVLGVARRLAEAG